MLYLLGVKSKTNLAATSALSFPLTPMWLGIQQKRISLFDIESSLVAKIVKMERGSYRLSDLACASFRDRPGNKEIQDGARNFL